MNYNELNILVKRKGFSMKELSSSIGITPNGLKKGCESGSLAIRSLISGCEFLGVTPNDFLGWPNSSQTSGIYASNISGVNTQNSDEAILALKEELKNQRAIIREKDKQINRLLAILERGKK